MPSFGLQLPSFTFSDPDTEIFANLRDRAVAAEEGGMSSVWLMDHFWQLPPLGGPDAPILEAYTTLGALAAVTEKVQLGTLVTGVTYRNPALLAKIVTTLDVISRGRAILGIGAAWYDVEHVGLGFDFPPVKERMDRLEEAVQICRAMFSEDAPSFSGTHYRIEGAKNLPRPIQARIPIMIGGGGEKRTLRLVAQYADQCNITGDGETIRHKIDVIRRHCADVGRDPSEIEITRMSTLIRTSSADETKATMDMLVQAAGAEAAAAFNVGQDDELLTQLEALAAVGVGTFIFNSPFADADGIRGIAQLVSKNLG